MLRVIKHAIREYVKHFSEFEPLIVAACSNFPNKEEECATVRSVQQLLDLNSN